VVLIVKKDTYPLEIISSIADITLRCLIYLLAEFLFSQNSY